jgi:HEAT repeat protein
MINIRLLTILILTLVVWCGAGATARAQSDDEEDGAQTNPSAAIAAKQLGSRDPLVRQRAAEELARLAATEQQKLVEGYRLQEKNSGVRLALDWALYRMGKTQTLFAIVRALDSSLARQAQSYLMMLEGPEPLYVFLATAKDKVKIRLFEVLARIGDAATIERIRPYTASSDQQVAKAAQSSINEITTRLAQAPPPPPSRPRQVGNGDETTP